MPPPRGTRNPIEGPADYTMTKLVHSGTYSAIDPTKCNLEGKAVFIAGASRGVGRSTAFSFARAGATYIAIGARSDLSETTSGILEAARSAGKKEPKVLALKLDTGDQKSTEAAAKDIEQHFGRLDIVINMAGVLLARGSITDTDPEEWWRVLHINLGGPYLISRACLPLLLKSDGGAKTIITVSSVGAHCVSPTLSAYQISKLAVLRLMEFVNAEYGGQGIVAFSVHPGNILTDIVGRGEGFDPELKACFTETPELCADSLVYLSNERREWLGGRYVNCTWDLPELLSDRKKEAITQGDQLKVRLVVD